MEDKFESNAIVPADDSINLPAPIEVDTESLREESRKILAQLVAEQDQDKAKDLTYLFNQNQNKKTAVRVNKLNDLLDVIADQTMVRFLTHPDEISNKELLDSLKIVQDLALNGQRQVTETVETPAPLIQINQQNNEVNVDGRLQTNLSRESRDKVKLAVEALLGGLKNSNELVADPNTVLDEELIVEVVDEDKPNN